MFDRLPDLLGSAPMTVDEIVSALIAGAAAVAIALLAHALVFRILKQIAHASGSESDEILVKRIARPARYSFIALALILAAREIRYLEDINDKVGGFVMPALVGWVALSILHALVDAMILRADVSVSDNRDARRKRTRLTIFSRIGSFVIIFVTVGLMLLSIPAVRDIGVALVASAGLAGLAVGAAAQPALKSLIGGVQMAITEPISLDDVVIIDGEWGKIEDIWTTYVVIRTWDERRLIVPVTKFLEESFQNWTKESAELLAPVILHLDPLTDIGPIRAEFERQVEANHLWDKRTKVLQVTDMTEESIEVRLLMSAHDAPTAFDLRCEIRESILAWIRENQPDAVPRRRTAAVQSQPDEQS